MGTVTTDSGIDALQELYFAKESVKSTTIVELEPTLKRRPADVIAQGMVPESMLKPRRISMRVSTKMMSIKKIVTSAKKILMYIWKITADNSVRH